MAARRLPRALKRPLTPKALSSMTRFLEIPADREFFSSCFTETDGRFLLRGDLTPGERERLARLHREIKANRRLISAGPLILLGLLAGVILVFTLFLAGPLLERSLERGLELAFGAQAEVTGLRLSPFSLRLTIAHVEVADRSSPMHNLFEAGPVEVWLDPEALLWGSLTVKTLRLEGLAFGTARTEPGDLPAQEGAEQEEAASPSPPSEGGPDPASVLAAVLDPSALDVEALLSREADRLQVVAARREVEALIREAPRSFEADLDRLSRRLRDLTSRVKELTRTNPSRISDPAALTALVSDAEPLTKEASLLYDEAGALSRAIEDRISRARALERQLRGAVEHDSAYLSSFLRPDGEAIARLLSEVTASILKDEARTYLAYARKGVEACLTLARRREGSPGHRREAPTGRVVHFPVKRRPGFWLRHLSGSGILPGGTLSLELTDLTSHPSLIHTPLTLRLSYTGSPRVGAQGTLDLSKDEPTYTLSLEAEGLELRDRSFPLFGALSATGSASFRASGTYPRTLTAGGSLSLAGPHLAPTGGPGHLVAPLLEGEESLSLTVSYRKQDQEESLEVTSPLFSSLAERLARALDTQKSELASRIEEELEARIRDSLAALSGETTRLDDLSRRSEALRAGAQGLREDLESHRRALEDRISRLRQELLEEKTDEVKEKASELLKDAAGSLLGR
ncbi:hypothetical protein [Spirochaeta thermophila]|uniref:TIGR03545 family protein n=1 Tax=Winmispira thermophila (strain ATCC 49972 / DSM 6192 / RI 19.B1) TaxID=665571 RepID=E0RPD5_WINT6|nr:hypothetical protein [Spirochaeta thermophila]ADN01329.1 hypothetical protein STHERM_c03560 [Spirochaeta thermophila DSM 6192]